MLIKTEIIGMPGQSKLKVDHRRSYHHNLKANISLMVK